MELGKLTGADREIITELFRDVFTNEPWNDDWSDEEQLYAYITDLTGQSYSLTFGFFDGDQLVALSMGYIKHWYSGTEYIINELCIRTERQGAGAGTFFIREIEKAIRELGIKQIFLLTDSNVPAYEFYRKNGFTEQTTNVSFSKRV
jgi:aminoglycoside 6'-N-acetyltransferase I